MNSEITKIFSLSGRNWRVGSLGRSDKIQPLTVTLYCGLTVGLFLPYGLPY